MHLKNIVTTGVLAGSLLMGTSAYAEGETSANTTVTKKKETIAGITPDSFFYTFDKLGEKIQLLFTNDPEKEANLLLQFANERLAETDKMTAQEKGQYIKKLIDEYLLTLQKAQEKVGEVVLNNKTTDQVKEDLSTKLEETTSVTEDVEQKLDTKRQTQLNEKRQEAYLVANIVKDIDPEKVKSLREQGLGFGEIVKVVTLAEASGKTEEEMVTLFKKGNGYGEVVKELNIEPTQITKNILEKKKKHLETVMEIKLKAGNQEAAEHIAKSIEAIEQKKIEFHITKNDEGLENGIDKKIAIIKAKAAAGLIPQVAADRKINILQNKAVKTGTEKTSENTVVVKDEETSAKKSEKETQKQLEKEKKEQEKAEQDKQKQLEKEKKEQDKAEQNKQKQLEKEKKEQEKAEQDKQKQLEKEKKEQDKAEQNKQKQLEKQKKEQEKAEQDKQKQLEKEKKEQEKAEQEKQKQLEKQKKEQEKAEQDKQKQLEKEKKEQEKAEQEKQKQLEKQKKEQEKAEQEKQKQLEKEKKEQEKAEQEKQKQLEKQKKEQEKAAKEEYKKEKKNNED